MIIDHHRGGRSHPPMFAPFGVRFLTQKSIPGCAISKHSGSRSLGAGAHSDKGGFATGFLNPRSAERPRREHWKPLNNLLPCASSFAIETGTPERRAPAEGQGTPCPCPSACILHPWSASTSAVISFSGPGRSFVRPPGFRSESPVGSPKRNGHRAG